MKRNLFLALLLFLNFSALVAQITKVDGPVGESLGKHDVQSIIGADNNAFYVFRREDEKILVQRYSKAKMTKEWETDISFKDKNIQSLDWRGQKLFYLRNGKIYLFMPAATSKKALLLLQVVGTDGKVDGGPKEIYSSDDEHVTDKYKKRVIEYKYSISADSSKVIYWFSYFNESFKQAAFKVNAQEGGGKEVTKITVIDLKNLKTLPIQFPEKFEGNDIIPGNFAISNDGYIALDFTYYVSDKTILHKASEDYPHYTIGMFNPATSELKGIVPDIGDKVKSFKGSAGIYFMTGNKFIASLILTDAQLDGVKRKDLNSGLYLGIFDAVKGNAEKQGLTYFSKAWSDKYLAKRQYMDDDYWNAVAHDFKFTPVDGGFIISAFNAATNHEAGWGDKYMLYSFAHDGMIFKITSSGVIEWNRVLPMYLRSIYTGGVYENHFYSNKKMYYLFDDNSDNIKNVDVNNVETSKDTKEVKEIDGKSVNTVCISYDLNGKAERTVIQNNKESGFLPLNKTVWADKNKILLYFKKDKKENFSTLTIQ